MSHRSLYRGDAPDFLDGLAISFGNQPQVDIFTSASTLGYVKTEVSQGGIVADALASTFDLTTSFIGYTPGSLGETSALLILLGGLFLLYKRVITWHIPVSMIGSLLLLATLFHWLAPDTYPGPLVHLLSGATLLGAFFIATDLVTSPVTGKGQLLFGAGCGLLVFVIRTWAGYPEGMAFAVLLMNALTPLIDHYISPRVYGRDRKGDPLAYDSKTEPPQ